MMSTPIIRYPVQELLTLAQGLLEKEGCRADIAKVVAEVLVEADLLGHDTHGLAQLPGYLSQLKDRQMQGDTHVQVLRSRAVAAHWNARRLPGPFVVRSAIDWAIKAAREHGLGQVAIDHSHHIACLAAYLEQPARAGFMVEIFSSDPGAASVAPFGGTRAIMTPNPIAMGIPAGEFDPIMVDISASITTNAMTNRMAASGQLSPSPWWVDAQGQPSCDPRVTLANPAGTLLPLGGADAGHKGYGLGLMVEALTAGLTGFGRISEAIPRWGATVLVRVTDPEAFGGLEAFAAQIKGLIQSVESNPAANPANRPRLPGHRGLQKKREQLVQGVALHPSIMPKLIDHS
jgi:LDH2 family malate/lactate/ureidoglycolate dehydrogenase